MYELRGKKLFKQTVLPNKCLYTYVHRNKTQIHINLHMHTVSCIWAADTWTIKVEVEAWRTHTYKETESRLCEQTLRELPYPYYTWCSCVPTQFESAHGFRAKVRVCKTGNEWGRKLCWIQYMQPTQIHSKLFRTIASINTPDGANVC